MNKPKSIFVLPLVWTMMLIAAGELYGQVSLDHVRALPLSPGATALHDAIRHPVEGNTGAIDISIPLYTIRSGGIEIPIVLRYSVESCKIDRSVAPNVAFGWVLDYGGMVNRCIKGRPDEEACIYALEEGQTFNQRSLSDQRLLSGMYSREVNSPLSYKYDSEYDEFVFSMPGGRGGSFTLYRTNPESVESEFDAFFSPNANYQIKGTRRYGNILKQLVLYDENGVRYTYGSGTDLEDAGYMELVSATEATTSPMSSGWALREVRDDGGNAVTFTYSRSGNFTSNIVHDQWYNISDSLAPYWCRGSAADMEALQQYGAGYTPEGRNNTEYFSTSYYKTLLPSTITFDAGTVDFTVSENHLSGFTIRDNGGNVVRSVVFSTIANNILQEEPLLNKIEIKDASGSVRQTYNLDYNSVVGGNYLSASCDWWGYFNGTLQSSYGYLPNRTFTGRGFSSYTPGALFSFPLGNNGNRSPSSTFILHNILKSIQYPSGGKSVFVFEPNTYSKEGAQSVAPCIGSGLRIASVTQYDKDGTTMLSKKTYDYGDGIISLVPGKASTTMDLTYVITPVENSWNSVSFIVFNRNRTVSPRWYPSAIIGPNYIVYESVTETIMDENSIVGKTISEYDVPNAYASTVMFANASETEFPLEQTHILSESLSYNSSYLVRKVEYGADNNPVRRTIYNYATTQKANLLNLGFFKQVYYIYPEATQLGDNTILADYNALNRLADESHCGIDAAVPLFYFYYRSSRGVRYLCGTTVETFTDNGTFSISSNSEISLTQRFNYPRKTSTQLSDGTTEEMEFKYPSDYSGSIYDGMVNAGRTADIVELKRYNRTSSGTRTLLETYLYEYGNVGTASAPLYRPMALKYAKGSNNLEVRQQYTAYDERGHLRSAIYEKDIHEHTLWGYGYLYPIMLICGPTWNELTMVVSESQVANLCTSTNIDNTIGLIANQINTNIGNVLTESVTYRLLYGVSNRLASSLSRTRYEYDNFQRLIRTSDANDFVLAEFSYNDGTAAGATFVRKSTPDSALTAMQMGSLAETRRRYEYTYYDGIYRAVQTNRTKASPNSQMDLIETVAYNVWGNIAKKTLPYPYAASGSYRADAISTQTQYYNGLYPGNGSYASYRTMYTGGALQMMEESWMPGSGAYASSATTRRDYGVNAVGEVRRFSVSDASSIAYNGYYAAGTLFKTTTTDPDGRVSVEYKNRNGQIVETRTGSGAELAKTSFVHDYLGNLIAVVPPKAQASSSMAPTLCYIYTYDGRNRCISAQLPDSGLTEYVYDADNRLVASRDAKQKAQGKWKFFRYDRLGREVFYGIVTAGNTAASLRSSYANATYHHTCSNSGPIKGYSNIDTKLPVSLNDVISVSYYDSYTYPSAKTFVAEGTPFESAAVSIPKGFITGRAVKIMDGNEHSAGAKWLVSTLFYDHRNRQIQSISDICVKSEGDNMRMTTAYRNQGEIRCIKEVQTVDGTANTLLTTYGYDPWGRQTYVTAMLNGAVTATSTIGYDALGRLMSVNQGDVQTIDYSYDIRNRLTHINNPESLGSDQFAMSLQYETTDVSGAVPQYGGNIAAVKWIHFGSSLQTYKYSYDSKARLTSGIHNGGNSESGISYDLNGNILTLTRSGAQATSLSYNYASGSNKLSSISVSGSAKSFAYDAMGNVTHDGIRNADITYSETYTPYTISKGSDTIKYIYDALGNKLAVQMNGSLLNYYAGNFVYAANGAIDHIVTPQGIIQNTNGTYSVQYDITDHLGSVRSVVNSTGTTIQSADYYPYGHLFSVPNIQNNPYLYNGKQYEGYSIGSSDLNSYDFGARHYDPITARWFQTDPLQQQYPNFSPFCYCADNPVNMVDVDGMEYGIKINYKNKIIIVYAHYTTDIHSEKSFKSASNLYNNRTIDKYSYKNLTFNVKFVLKNKSIADATSKAEDALNSNSTTGENYYISVSSKNLPSSEKGVIVTGSTKNKYVITISRYATDLTGAHEIGHTLNLVPNGEHSDKGIMTANGKDEHRSAELLQENINYMINSKLSGFQRMLLNIYSLFQNTKDYE